MAITVVQTAMDNSSGTRSTATISSTSTTAWAPPTAGNFLLAAVVYDTNSRTMATPTGWTVAANGQTTSTPTTVGLVVYSKVSAGTETSTAFVCSNALDFVSAVMYELSGAAASATLDVSVGAQSGTSATTGTTPTGTPSVTGGMVVAFHGTGGNLTITTSSPNWSIDRDNANFKGVAAGHKSVGSSAGVGESMTFTLSAADVSTTMLVVVPAGASAGAPLLRRSTIMRQAVNRAASF